MLLRAVPSPITNPPILPFHFFDNLFPISLSKWPLLFFLHSTPIVGFQIWHLHFSTTHHTCAGILLKDYCACLPPFLSILLSFPYLSEPDTGELVGKRILEVRQLLTLQLPVPTHLKEVTAQTVFWLTTVRP